MYIDIMIPSNVLGAEDLGITLPSAESTQLDKDFFQTPGCLGIAESKSCLSTKAQKLEAGVRFCDHEFDSADENKDGKASLSCHGCWVPLGALVTILGSHQVCRLTNVRPAWTTRAPEALGERSESGWRPLAELSGGWTMGRVT